nr:uncharacterized protein LOC128691678 [Cherax quadricarinatus]
MMTVWCITTGVRVSAATVSAATVTSLPSTPMVALDLTDVTDDIVSRACDLAQELQPPGGYWKIECGSKVTVAGIQDMIHHLHHRSVKMEVVPVETSVSITRQQRRQLLTLAKSTLNCRLIM